MKISSKITGIGAVQAELRQLAQRAGSSARHVMAESAERIARDARINAPRDKWNLEESIHIQRDYGGINRRVRYNISVGGTINGVNVDEYAAMIHENYEDMIVDDDNPDRRQGTKEKQAQYPDYYIGGKFLQRAVDDNYERLVRNLVTVITNIVEDY